MLLFLTKECKSDMINNWNILNDYKLNSDYGRLVLDLLDSNIEVVRYTYSVINKYDGIVNNYNRQIPKYEALIKEILEKEYKTILTTEEERRRKI